MEYEGRICSPPMERASFQLPVMTGCQYNSCKFCNLFRDIKYRELPLKQIEEELLRVKKINGNPSKIFLGDGNAFGLKTAKLLRISELIHNYFPNCKSINSDATVTGILQKTDEELKLLYGAGIKCLYIGIETGLDDVLRFMNKDHNNAQAELAIGKIKKCGYVFGAHIMSGIAGADRGIENAKATASFLNKMKPVSVINFSMFLHKEVPLYNDIIEGNYRAAHELENLKEEHYLLELIDVDTTCPIAYEGFHDFLGLRVRGNLPYDKNKMLTYIENKIKQYELKAPEYAFVCGECSKALEKDNGAAGKVWDFEVKI